MPRSHHKASNKSLSYHICRKETFYNGSMKQRISKTSCLEADIWFRNSFQIMSVLQAQRLSSSEGRLRFEVLLEGHSPTLPRYLNKQPGHMEIMTSTRQRKSSSISPYFTFLKKRCHCELWGICCLCQNGTGPGSEPWFDCWQFYQ